MSTRFTVILNSAALFAFTASPLFAAPASIAIKPKPAVLQPQQQFQQPSVILTGNWPAGIASADLNGDGSPDLIYTDYGATPTASTTHILLNNGNGAFTPGQTIATAGASIAVADFDRDGHPDLEWVWIVQGQGRVYFAHGNGDGTFAPTIELGTFAQIGNRLPQLAFITAAPMHDSGYLDLLVEDTANSTLFELTADSSNTLVRLFGIQLPDGTGPIFTTDLNGDGHTDLVLQTPTAIDVFLGSANGIIQTPNFRYPLASGALSSLLQDVDADGHPDLILEESTGRITILHGFPDGTFATPSEGGTGALNPAAGAGGHLIGITPPTAKSAQNLYTSTPAGISALQLQPNLSLALQGIFNAGPGSTSYVLADFNGDGFPDIALDSPEGIAILFATPAGTLQSSLSFSANAPALSATLGAFTASGFIDAAAATATLPTPLLHGNGDGTFTLPSNSAAQSPITPTASILTGDFNADGRLDLAIPTTLGLQIEYGNGDGTFTPPTPVTSLPGNAIAATLNSSGRTALAISDPSGDSIITPNPSGAFTTTTLAPATTPGLIAAGDLNHDGLIDLVFQNASTWTIYLNGPSGLNSATGAFSSVSTLPNVPTNLNPTAATIADLDGDGNGDIIIAFDNPAANHANPIAAAPNQLYIWYGNGDGAFTAPIILTPTRNFTQVVAANMQGGSLPDLVLTDGYLVGILRNLGSRTFSSEQHLLAGQSINTISAADLNHDGTTDLVLSNGALSNGALSNSSHPQISAPSTGGVTILLNHVEVQAVSGTLTASPATTPVGATYTITAAVAPLASGPTPTGNISFAIDGAPIGAASVTSGIATITAPGTAPVGVHTLTAQYSGDATYAATQLNTTHAVTGISTTIVLSITTPFTLYYGQMVDGFAQVQSADHGQLTGTITFYDGAANLCTIPVSATISCPASAGTGFAPGIHTLTAAYSGDTTHSASTTTPVTVTILPGTTSATLLTSLNPAPTAAPVTLTATLAGNFATPTGPVAFYDGAILLGTAALNSAGSASLTLSTLTAGAHNLTAVYAATTNFSAAASAALSQTITPAQTAAATAILLSSSANPATAGQTLTLTANVANIAAGSAIPTGTVTFIDGATPIATATLNPSGLATFTTSTLAVGTHGITASYPGNTLSGPSLSSTFLQVVSPTPVAASPSFVIGVNNSTGSSAVTVETGGTANIVVKVSPVNGFNQPVQLACANLPGQATCTFAAVTMPAGGGTTTAQLLTLAPRACGSSVAYGQTARNTPSSPLPYAAPLLAGILAVFLPKRRRLFKGLISLIAIAGLLAIAGCGACTNLGTLPGSYTVQITGTSTGSAPVTVIQTVQVNVTE